MSGKALLLVAGLIILVGLLVRMGLAALGSSSNHYLDW